MCRTARSRFRRIRSLLPVRIIRILPPKVELTIASALSTPSATTSRSRVFTVLLVLGVIITAVNLRIVIIAVSPLLDQIRASTGLSSTAAGLLTTLPVLCFGIFAPLAPRLARRFGLDLVLLGTMIVLTLGILIRFAPGTPLLFIGTGVIGIAIAIGNVLLPASIKRDFPHQLGVMTGLLTMAISASGTIGAGFTIPLQKQTGFDWRGTLALWAIPVVVAVIALIPRLRLNQPGKRGPAHRHVPINLWRDPVAWAVTLIMGLQSFSFYALATWFPTMMAEHGMSSEHAGLLLSLANFAGFFSSFFVPVFASRRRDQRVYVLAMAVCWSISLGGLLIAPMTLTLLWMILWGAAAGAALSLSLSFITLRSPDAPHAAQLSGMAQTVGYCLAATGPSLMGALRDTTGSWSIPLLLLQGILAVMLIAGLNAGKDRLVGQVPAA